MAMHETTQEMQDTLARLRRTMPERMALNERAIQELITSGIKDTAIKTGEKIRDFSLPDAHGNLVNIGALLNRGPIVITFYRGSWCPYCNIELRGLQKILPEIDALGASLVAISPQSPRGVLPMAEHNRLTFLILSDYGNKVAKQFGIVFTLPPSLIAVNEEFLSVLLEANGQDGASELPMPATFIVDSERIVHFAFMDEDWTKRLDPDDILEHLRRFWEAD